MTDTMSIVLRPSTLNDAKRIRELELIVFPKERAICANDIKRLLRKETPGYLLERNGELIGYIAIIFSRSEVEIVRLIIKEEHRRTGLASELIGEAQTHLTPERNSLWCEAPETNLPLQLTLRHNGFSCVKIDKDHEFDNEDRYIFKYTGETA